MRFRSKQSGGDGHCRLFYASDIHGSDRCFRKWVNAARVYQVDALVFGGDIAGKIVVPVVRFAKDRYVVELQGRTLELAPGEELQALRGQIRASGRYDVVLSPDEKRLFDQRPDLVASELFPMAMRQSVRSWLELAERRLEDAGVPALVMLGNDDDPELAGMLGGRWLRYVEERVVELPGGFEMISFGYSNRTPWDSPRELDDDDLGARVEGLARQLRDPEHAVFNLHCPPHGTHLDQAALLDDQLRPRTRGGQVLTGPVGSAAVRELIERYQPMLGLHGHIHESPGAQRLGRSFVLNPGSEYGDGVLRGALVTLDRSKGVRSWQLVQG
ncbi:MAG TPA: metallophosphoesterase [Actinomycetes bacterium]|jgi:Icc-related predicted phosphoesterase|nr:metallophosphoesterase [Actinomycetes bacterium]